MQIALVHLPYSQPPDALVASVASIPHIVTTARPAGLSAIPAIAALDELGQVRREWRLGDPIDGAELADWAARDGAPAPTAPAPTPAARPLTQLEFRLLLTPAEREAARQARKADPVYNDFLELLDIATEVDLGNPLTIGGLTYAASLGVFSPERLADILAGRPPAAEAPPALSETDTTWS